MVKKSKAFPPLAAKLQSPVANLKLTISSTLSHGMQLCKTKSVGEMTISILEYKTDCSLPLEDSRFTGGVICLQLYVAVNSDVLDIKPPVKAVSG